MQPSTWIIIALYFTITCAADIELMDCDPPDQPRWGGYGPRQDSYVPGDTIHYYCDADTFIGGNYLRKCEDTGDWTGDTPVCDVPSTFSSTTQSSIADDSGNPGNAIDGLRSTCTSTRGGKRDEWYGIFTTPGELIRVMLFLPKGPVSYEVVLVKSNGEEIICGSQTSNVDRYDWHFQNCPGPNNRDASGVKIRSLTDSPLQICELAAYVLTSPTCVDPHYRIESGRLRLDRKSAVLMCNPGYTRSSNTALQCVRDGVWNRKTLYCSQRQWEIDERDPVSPERGMPSDKEPKPENPERERLEV